MTIQDPIECTQGHVNGCAWTAIGIIPFGKVGKIGKLAAIGLTDEAATTAANTGAGVVESSVARTLAAAEQRSVASLQRQVAAHTEKLGAYRASPDAFDNLGYLERAPSPEIRQRIIDGRINHLETEIRGFQDQIDKLLGGS